MNEIVPVETHDPQILKDIATIASKIDQARALFDEGDAIAAKMLASGGYDMAKALAQFARRAKALAWVDKSRRMQGDALLIEMLSKMQISREWDIAQGTGEASKGGRPKKKTVENGDGFTSAQAGLTRDEIAEGRKLLAAEAREPGLVEKAIAARIEAGLEPSRRAVKHAIGTKTATREERGNNLYETGPEAMAVLLGLESFLPLVLESSCGPGAIARAMEADGHEMILSDLVDYGTADQHGQVQQVRDFLAITRDEIEAWAGGEDFDLVTNPPYGEVLNAYVAHALTVIRPRKMALLLNLNFLAGCEDRDRNQVLDQMSPERCIVFSRRLPMMHRDGYDGQKSSSQMNTMWVIWERGEDGSYAGAFRIQRADWRDFQDIDLIKPPAPRAARPDLPAVADDEDLTRETPRRSLDERVEEHFTRAMEWMRGVYPKPFDLAAFRKGIAVRESTAAALLVAMSGAGLVKPMGDETWTPTGHGLSTMATVGAVEAIKALKAGKIVCGTGAEVLG